MRRDATDTATGRGAPPAFSAISLSRRLIAQVPTVSCCSRVPFL